MDDIRVEHADHRIGKFFYVYLGENAQPTAILRREAEELIAKLQAALNATAK